MNNKLQISKELYSLEFLEKICDDIGTQNIDERNRFIKKVRHAGDRYKTLVKSNSGRIRPTIQNNKLDTYKNTLEKTKEAYKEITGHSTVNDKLQKAIRKKLERCEEPSMKEMLEPYCTENGFATTLFEKFLEFLAEAAEEAKSQDVGNDKADISGKLFTLWVATIGKAWPDDAQITFALGKRDKELNMHTSPSIPIVHKIVSHIENGFSEKNVETSMRMVIKEKLLNQPIAIFLVG